MTTSFGTCGGALCVWLSLVSLIACDRCYWDPEALAISMSADWAVLDFQVQYEHNGSEQTTSFEHYVYSLESPQDYSNQSRVDWAVDIMRLPGKLSEPEKEFAIGLAFKTHFGGFEHYGLTQTGKLVWNSTVSPEEKVENFEVNVGDVVIVSLNFNDGTFVLHKNSRAFDLTKYFKGYFRRMYQYRPKKLFVNMFDGALKLLGAPYNCFEFARHKMLRKSQRVTHGTVKSTQEPHLFPTAWHLTYSPCGNVSKCTANTKTAAARCCGTTVVGSTHLARCESIATRVLSFTYEKADELCKSIGQRLCSPSEVEAGACCVHYDYCGNPMAHAWVEESCDPPCPYWRQGNGLLLHENDRELYDEHRSYAFEANALRSGISSYTIKIASWVYPRVIVGIGQPDTLSSLIGWTQNGDLWIGRSHAPILSKGKLSSYNEGDELTVVVDRDTAEIEFRKGGESVFYNYGDHGYGPNKGAPISLFVYSFRTKIMFTKLLPHCVSE